MRDIIPDKMMNPIKTAAAENSKNLDKHHNYNLKLSRLETQDSHDEN